MRVLHVDSGREWRGGQNQVRLLCRELKRRADVELCLVTRRASELATRTRADGAPVVEVPWTIGVDPQAAWALGPAIRRFRPDLVHVHDSHALGVTLATLGALGVLFRARPLVVATRRVDFPVRRPRWKVWLLGESPWRRADHIVAISEAVRAVLLRDGIAPDAITVVRSGIDPDEVRRASLAPLNIRRRLGLDDRTPLAVNVAALVNHKDQRTLTRAARAARARRPDLHWVIAGEGELRGSLEAEIAGLALGDRVHLLGYVPQADALIREGDVFVMSSKEEGLGSVILHALALEKPVVATRGGGIPEVVPERCLVPVGDAEGLARKVVEALDHPAPFPLPPRFTARAMAEGVLAVYRSLL